MSLLYNLAEPVKVGDLNHSVQVSQLQLSSISINFEPAHRKNGQAVLSVILHDTKTGYPVNVVYQDAHSLALAQAIEERVGEEILQKLISDGKLPAGKLTPAPETQPAS